MCIIDRIMTDTDSLLYSIRTDDVYSDMKEDLQLFDTSDYPTDHPCHCDDNKKVVGKFKDETSEKPIREFVGLRAKYYSLLLSDCTDKKVAKGVPRTAIKKRLRHQLYSCLLYTSRCV